MISRTASGLLLAVSLGAARSPQATNNRAVGSAVTNAAGGVQLPGPPGAASSAAAREFWPGTLKDCVGLAKDFAVLAAALVGFFGIKAWRKEFVGKRRVELAEEVLALFYQARDVIEIIRSPVGYAGEGSRRKVEAAETPEQKQIRDDSYATRERYNQNRGVFCRIFTLRHRFMAQLGREADAPFVELKSILDGLFVALRRWVRLSQVKESTFTNTQSLEGHHARIEEYENTLWGLDDNDAVRCRVDELIRQIEGICEPQITGRRRGFRPPAKPAM
jgi:hypothetical protein